MKQCQMHISPAPECLVPCPEKATEVVPLGQGMSMFLCKKHYQDMNETFKDCCADVHHNNTENKYKELN